MNTFIKSIVCRVTAILLSFLAARNAAAVDVTLKLIPAQSSVALSGAFVPLTFSAQEGLAGVTDLNPAMPSTQTTFQGTIKVSVNSLVAPTSIKILSSAADADVNGIWLPEVELFQDLDMDGNFGEFGADSLPTAGDNPAPSVNADWGIKVRHPSGVDVAFGGYRDIVYNVTSGVEAVNASGEFSSLTENFEFATGWLDYWVHQTAGNVRGRAELAGGDDNNMSATPSKFTVTSLGGGAKELRLFIPIHIDDMGTTLHTFYDGQFVATVVVPEPVSLMLGLTGTLFVLFGRRTRS